MSTQKKKGWLLYEAGMCVLGLVSFIGGIAKFFMPLPEWWDWILWGTEGIFLTEYMVKLIQSGKVYLFVSQHGFDNLCILPIPELKILRLYRIRYIVRNTGLRKVPRIRRFAAFTKPFRRAAVHAKTFLDTNGFKYMLLLASICILLGAFGIMVAERMNFQDAIWWSFVTVTTVGYGDLSPATANGRMIAMVLMVVGIGLVGSLTSTLTSLFMNMKETSQSLEDNLISQVKGRMDHLHEMSDEDVRELCDLIWYLHKKK